jgi:hypothetical protein
MDRNPEKWWGGGVSDRASSTTLYDPHEFSDSPILLNAGKASGATYAAAAPIPGNPETVQPFFSTDEMNEASGIDNPAAFEHAVRRMGANAMGIMGGMGNTSGGLTEDLPQPMPTQDAVPQQAAFTGQGLQTAPAAPSAPYVPADPRPASSPTPAIAPPPVEEEARATYINPADAAAEGETLDSRAVKPLP